MTLIIGIDDAGRGPLIGPMILAGVLLNKEQEKKIKEKGAKDSKLLSHSVRIELSEFIVKNSLNKEIVISNPEEIDTSIQSGTNLNTLEAIKTAEIINKLNSGKVLKESIKVYVDCPSNNILSWKNKLISFINNKDNLDIYCEHKADINHPSVSSASILAKVRREEEVSKIKKQFKEYGDIGSGYPSDPMTKEFLKKHGEKLKDSGIFRKTWATWKAIFPEISKKQSTLREF